MTAPSCTTSALGRIGAQAHKPPNAPASLRLYIFDCAIIHTINSDAYSLKKEEMASTEMSIPFEERALNRLPVADFNREQTAASRAALETFLEKTGARLWIEHDIIANARLRKAPAFHD